MTVYLPDTNILIDALRDKGDRRRLLASLVSGGNALACCDITMAEIYSGMQPHARTDYFLSTLVWRQTNRAIAKRAGLFRFKYARAGITLSLSDALIAATAIEHELTLITGNRKHFPMPELRIYSDEDQK